MKINWFATWAEKWNGINYKSQAKSSQVSCRNWRHDYNSMRWSGLMFRFDLTLFIISYFL